MVILRDVALSSDARTLRKRATAHFVRDPNSVFTNG